MTRHRAILRRLPIPPIYARWPWAKIRADDTVTVKTILFEGHVAGHIAKFERFGEPEITYWIDKEHWGKGVATAALSLFLNDLRVRPLYARAAEDHIASLRVLEKCGFAIFGNDRGFANARGEEIEDVKLKQGKIFRHALEEINSRYDDADRAGTPRAPKKFWQTIILERLPLGWTWVRKSVGWFGLKLLSVRLSCCGSKWSGR